MKILSKMSGQEDFGPLVEVLVACVGFIDVISLFGYLLDRTVAKEPTTDANNNDVNNNDVNNNDVSQPLRQRDKSPRIESSSRSVPQVLIDGVAKPNDDVIDSLMSKVNELEAKVVELEIKSREGSMERLVEMERYRRSRSPSPFQVTIVKDEEDSSYDDETNTSSTESRGGSVRHLSKPISRDDEFRKTMKRSSQQSHESREDELNDFTLLEKQESENMDDYVPITYEGQDDTGRFRHGISPIQEIPSSPIHGEIERSPEPGMSSLVEKPWCDIKKDAAERTKLERKDQLRRSLSIDEQPAAEAKASNEPMKVLDVNENFIKMEQNAMQQQHAKLLVKQAHVSSEDQLEEETADLQTTPFEVVEIKSEPEVTVEEVEVKQNVLTNNDAAPPVVAPSTDIRTESVSNAVNSTATTNVSSQTLFIAPMSLLFASLLRIMQCVQRHQCKM